MRYLLLGALAIFGVRLFASDTLNRTQQVYTGVYLMNIYDLNVNAHSFYADFYLWFKWKGDKDPTKIEFVNSVEKWAMTQTVFYDTAQILPDGYHYNGMRVEGRFYHPFELGRFPLDSHTLSIELEHTDYPQETLTYIADTNKKRIREGLKLPGWNIESVQLNSNQNLYSTTFGNPGESFKRFSNFTLELTLQRPYNYFLLKLMIPLSVVVIACIGSLWIVPVYLDARISLPIAGLLTAVFLQQSYGDALPDVGYMVLMDKIYLLTYIVIAAILFRIVYSTLFIDKTATHKRLFRKDLLLSLVIIGGYVASVMALVAWG